jgi:multicomponent Na+:H+ antiporter subunit B
MLTERRAIAHAKRDAHATEPLRRPRLGAALAIATLVVLAIGLIGLPPDNVPLPDIARYALEIALPRWKTTEPVNEIVYGSRGFDTFGETFLLLAAVVSVVTLARPREPRREYVGEAKAGEGEQARIDPDDDQLPRSEAAARRAEQAEEAETGEFIPADRIPLGTRGAERSPEMSVVVRIAARTVAPLLAVAAVYLVAWGYSPGGGFPGGAALAGVVVLLYAALGHRRVRAGVRPGVLEPIELAGAMAIILIVVLGLVLKGSATANWVPLAQPQTIRSGGVLQPFSVSELLEVSTGMTIAIFTLLGMRHEWTPDESRAEEDHE